MTARPIRARPRALLSRCAGSALALAAVLLSACGDDAKPAAAAASPEAQRAAQLRDSARALRNARLRVESIVDPRHGNSVAATWSVPADWQASSSLVWTFSDASWPVRAGARTQSADGSAWVELYPAELFYWLSAYYNQPIPIGKRGLGAIHHPQVDARTALVQYVIRPARARVQNLQIVAWRNVPNLAEALGKPAVPGESIAVRVTYARDGVAMEEEFYALLADVERLSHTGGQGTSYQFNRKLIYVHSIGAVQGQLDRMRPLLGFVAASARTDPAWEQMAGGIYKQIAATFNQNLARGYAQIAAAGALSRQISANNDARLRTLQAQRAAGNAAAAARRGTDSGAGAPSANDEFSKYIRGVERYADPATGTSEQSSNQSYHWTDGFGSYQGSNDAGYNPNVGSTSNWQLMEPARR